MSFDNIMARIEELGLAGRSGWDGNTDFRCPAHDDASPSARIREADDGKTLVVCHAGCSAEDIMKALELPMAELFGNPRVVDEYVYVDLFNRPVIKVERLEPGEGGKKKSFRQFRWDTALAAWVPGVSELEIRPLYNLPAVAAAQTVYLVEGEKDADRLEADLAAGDEAATTGIGGAEMWRPEWTDDLTGKDVIIVPDEDDPGLKRAKRVAAELEGKAASVTIRHVRAGKDYSDHADAGYGPADLTDVPPLRESRFLTFTPETIAPAPDWAYEPFLIERSLIWFFGPSGHGKSIALDYAVAEMTRRNQRVLYFDWESPELEATRLAAMGANWNALRLHGMDPDNPCDFGTDWFQADVRAEVEAFQPSLVVFNTFTAMYAERAGADAWNIPVREAGMFCRGLARDFGPAVVVVDHQENVDALHAHGGRSKKAWSELYLKVTQDQEGLYDGEGTYRFKIESLKQSRRQLKTVHATVKGRVEDGDLRIYWDFAPPMPSVSAQSLGDAVKILSALAKPSRDAEPGTGDVSAKPASLDPTSEGEQGSAGTPAAAARQADVSDPAPSDPTAGMSFSEKKAFLALQRELGAVPVG